MANIASGDVTYAMLNERRKGDSRAHNRVRLSFGNGVLTYPAGGIPVLKGKMGCPTVIESLCVVDKGAEGYNFMYDQSAEKLLLFRTDQINDPEEEPSAVAITAQVVEAEVIGY